MIKIDMEMPKNCKECCLSEYGEYGLAKMVCTLTKENVIDYDAYRVSPNCPLIDCATSDVTTYCSTQFVCINEFTVLVNDKEVCLPLGSIWNYSDAESGESWYVLYPEDSCVGLSFIQICDLEFNENFMEVI